MKNIASAVILLGALAGTAYAGTPAAQKGTLPEGIVTVQEIPTVLVEAKRWTQADEVAYQKAHAQKVSAAKPGFWSFFKFAYRTDRDARYAVH